MNQHKMMRGSMVALVLASASAAACERSRTEETEKVGTAETHGATVATSTATEPPAQVITSAQPATTAQPPATAQPTTSAQPPATAQPTTSAQPPATAETPPTTSAQPTAAVPSQPTSFPPFEGELQMTAKGKTPESLDYAMKGDKIRIGIAPSGAKGKKDKGVDAIIDTTDKKATILLNDKKEFVEVDLGKAPEKAKPQVENVDVERTGRMDTVAGRQCEEWKLKDRDYQVNACVTQGAPSFDLDALEQQAKFKAPLWVHRLVDDGYIPLRVDVSDAKGKPLVSSQADTSHKVDASKFEVPVGYRKADASKLQGTPKR